MSSTTFQNFQQPAIDAAWLNDTNRLVYDLCGNGTDAPASVPDVRTNLGLGTVATQNANNVAITGGSITGGTITGITPLGVAAGGTGLGIATPIFSVNRAGDQAIPASTPTEVVFNTVETDSLGAFDTGTGRFTPTVAGWYQVSAGTTIAVAGGVSLNAQIILHKNGAAHKRGSILVMLAAAGFNILELTMSSLVFLNGTTDYISMFVFGTPSAGTVAVIGGATSSWFNGHFVRS